MILYSLSLHEKLYPPISCSSVNIARLSYIT